MSTRIAVLAGIALVAAAFIGGYWPTHQQAVALEARLVSAESELTTARAGLRVSSLLGDLLNLTQLVAQQDFGQAQTMSSRFFDAVRAEATASPDPRLRDALGAVLQQRDAVTASLTRADPSTLVTLTDIQRSLRRALGYPVAPLPVPETAVQ